MYLPMQWVCTHWALQRPYCCVCGWVVLKCPRQQVAPLAWVVPPSWLGPPVAHEAAGIAPAAASRAPPGAPVAVGGQPAGALSHATQVVEPDAPADLAKGHLRTAVQAQAQQPTKICRRIVRRKRDAKHDLMKGRARAFTVTHAVSCAFAS
jgi:hypothetical protein